MMRTPSFILAMASALMMLRGRVDQRRVERDEVGALEQLVELDLLDAQRLRALRREERIVGDDLHVEADARGRRRSSRYCRRR